LKEINKHIEEAETLDGSFYSSNSIFQNSLNLIFSNNWQFVISIDKISNHGDVYPFNFLGNAIPEPLFLINDNNKIKCYSNVCTHRGNILITKPGSIKNVVTCGYHGKQFDINGNFKFMPCTDGMKNFPNDKDNLVELPVFIWKGLIFVSLDPIITFDSLFRSIDKRVGWMPVEKFKYREDLSKEYFVEANWALYCDNYLEGFHIPFIHNDLNAVLDFQNYDVEIFKYSNLQIGIASDNDICFELPENSIDYGKKIAAYYFWVFPNLMLNFYPWGLSLNKITPISVKETKVQFKSYVWDESKLDMGAGADLHKVELEDEEVVQQVQKGVSSRFYNHGRFSPKMEKGVHHFHTLISDFVNKKIPNNY